MSRESGWYPPGAEFDPSAPWNQTTDVCEMCEQEVNHCTCPVCPCCGVQGDPACYDDQEGDVGHELQYTQDQKAVFAAKRRKRSRPYGFGLYPKKEEK